MDPLRPQLVRLGALLGGLYFVQGLCEPNEGLISQPVRSLLRSQDRSPSEIGLFMAAMSLPWALKPLYGVLTDFFPFLGTRRRHYLIGASLIASLGLLGAWLAPQEDLAPLLLMLSVSTTGIAFADVVTDAFMVERGKPLGLTGTLQSIQWTAMWGATVIAGSLGGYLSAQARQMDALIVCALLNAVTVLLAFFFVKEPALVEKPDFKSQLPALREAMRSKPLRVAAAFLILWNFNPFSHTVLYLHVVDTLKLDEQFYGDSISLMAVTSAIASAVYAFYCRKVRFSTLAWSSVVLGVLGTALNVFIRDRTSAIVITLLVGFIYQSATLIQLDLAARACPSHVEGTVFAFLMAVSNLSTSMSSGLGASLYEGWVTAMDPATAFHLLVGIGALSTCACVVPLLSLPADELGH